VEQLLEELQEHPSCAAAMKPIAQPSNAARA
jgi:hypothetical protein